MTDEILLERAGRGDEAAFLELYERYRDAMFRFAFRLLGSIELAEDVTHDLFLSLIRQPDNFDPERASLRTYLYAATRNLAMKHFRRREQEMAVEELTAEPRLPPCEEPLRKLLDEEIAALVAAAIAALAPLQREALILFEYEGLTLSEIAAVTGAEVGTIKARLHRARQGLRRSLGPYFKGSPEKVAVESA
jgi:RNA polymerase sigma-70 factor (ECF subfamily)